MANFSIAGPTGALEASLWAPTDRRAPVAVAAVCHPHPLYGGNMNSSVVFRTARGLQQAGLAALRFNFRGVGASEGRHDGQGGEVDDLGAVLEWLAREYPDAERWGAGFSFGSRTVLARAASDSNVRRVVLIALPVSAFDCSALARVSQPGLIVMAENDEYGTMAELRRQFPSLQASLDVTEIPGTNHFFEGATQELQSRVREYASKVHTRSA